MKALEAIGVYNIILDYGDRAYGRIVTIINRSEVVGRPLAALLANDGARVFSVDIDYTKIVSCGEDQKICIWDVSYGIDTSFIKL